MKGKKLLPHNIWKSNPLSQYAGEKLNPLSRYLEKSYSARVIRTPHFNSAWDMLGEHFSNYNLFQKSNFN